MDPLQRPVAAVGDAAESRATPAYYRGFYDAEKRRKVVNHDVGAGQAVAGAVLSLVPIALLGYLLTRGRRSAAGKGGTWMQQLQQSMQSMMDPMGQKNFRVAVKGTTFKDVIGVPEAVNEVRQYVDFLTHPGKFTRLGARLPKGCVLTGEPGTGKTLLAKAVAGEADVPFFSCSGADFIEVYAGSGPKRVRELFAEARAAAPAIIFIDEIDAVGSRSGGGSSGALGLSSEENRTINQLLAELDGLGTSSDAIVVFAATNFVESLDKALLREGRFDRKVVVDMPDVAARRELFAHYLGKVVTASDTLALARRLATLTPGVSPATIAAIVNEAALSAAITAKAAVTEMDLLPAIDDVLVGKKHRSRMTDEAARRVALHESGHALTAWLLAPEQSDVVKVSITPRGAAAGFTQQLGREVRDLTTDFSLFTDICVMLGGRAAELQCHDNLTTGAQDDYQRATATALRAFLSFGMSPHGVGLLSYEPQRLQEGRMHQRHSSAAQAAAEVEAARLVGAAATFVRDLLHTHRATLLRLADELAIRKELLHEDVERIAGKRADDGAARVSVDARRALARFVHASEQAALQRTTARASLLHNGASDVAPAPA